MTKKLTHKVMNLDELDLLEVGDKVKITLDQEDESTRNLDAYFEGHYFQDHFGFLFQDGENIRLAYSEGSDFEFNHLGTLIFDLEKTHFRNYGPNHYDYKALKGILEE